MGTILPEAGPKKVTALPLLYTPARRDAIILASDRTPPCTSEVVIYNGQHEAIELLPKHAFLVNKWPRQRGHFSSQQTISSCSENLLPFMGLILHGIPETHERSQAVLTGECSYSSTSTDR